VRVVLDVVFMGCLRFWRCTLFYTAAPNP